MKVFQFYLQHKEKGKIFTANQLVKQGVKRRYFYKVISSIESGQIWLPHKKSGPRPTQLTSEERRKLRGLTDGKIAPSLRSLESKFGHRRSTIKRELTRMGINYHLRTKRPKVSPTQEQRQKERLAAAIGDQLDPTSGRLIIMDDESYFRLSRHSTAPAYYEGRIKPAECVKYKRVEKFDPKIMVWAAISSLGISHFAVFENNTYMDTNLYKNIIATHLLTFIEDYHSDGNYIFWPDLASCHYSKATIEKYKALGINYVSKEQNPPNCPQLRPIEKFWAHLKHKVYLNGFEAKNVDQLNLRILHCLKQFDPGYFKNLFKNLNEKLLKAHRHGLNSVL